MDQRPPVSRILRVDWISNFTFLVPLAMWPIYPVTLIVGGGRPGNWGFPGTLAIITIAFWIALFWRVAHIRAVVSSGIEALGTVKSVRSIPGGGTRITYAYTHDRGPYFGANTTADTRATHKLKPGDTMALVVDPARPGVSYIRALYA